MAEAHFHARLVWSGCVCGGWMGGGWGWGGVVVAGRLGLGVLLLVKNDWGPRVGKGLFRMVRWFEIHLPPADSPSLSRSAFEGQQHSPVRTAVEKSATVAAG